MKTQVLLVKVHSMILLSYCFSSLVACADRDERRHALLMRVEKNEEYSFLLLHMRDSVRTCDALVYYSFTFYLDLNLSSSFQTHAVQLINATTVENDHY